MLSVIVFSKDRPLQLDLALKSLKENLGLEHKVTVIYFASKEFEKAYIQLLHEHPYVEFIDERSYDGFYHSILRSLGDEYVMFMTDDNIFYRKSKTTELDLGNLFSKGIACLSLRLGLNITHRDGYPSQQPTFERVAGYHLLWNRMTILPQNYFGYVLSVDCHIFRAELIECILRDMHEYRNHIWNPNNLEEMLQRYFFEIPTLMACELYSCVVNSPNNRVQDSIQNLHGQVHSYHQDHLLKLFNDGLRLNLEDIEFPQINCPHQEIRLI